MLFTKSFIVAVMAIAGSASAAVRPPPPKPAPVNVQNIQCSGGAAPYCCSPSQATGSTLQIGDQSQGSTCSKLGDGNVQCNAFVVCCNNNGANALQSCTASLQQPVIFI